MPIYDYVCRDCGHVLEVIHPVDAAGPSECPVCGGQMRRAISRPAIVFKGSGWAKKDAQSSTRSAPAKEATEPAKTDGGSSAGTAEAPQAKPASPEAS